MVFARILPDFLPEYGYFKNSRGGGGGLQPGGVSESLSRYNKLFSYFKGICQIIKNYLSVIINLTVKAYNMSCMLGPIYAITVCIMGGVKIKP